MGTRKADEQHVRTITQNSTGTYSVSLPITTVRGLRWQRKQKVVIRQQGKRLIIEDWRG